MATKAQVIKRVEELSCSMDYDGEEVTISAPHGYTVDGLHYFTNVKSNGENTMAEVWGECLDVMQSGIEECIDRECDVCGTYA